jgi:lysophospholipid acyltransferase (LPLAT)-like uncharacterized protein
MQFLLQNLLYFIIRLLNSTLRYRFTGHQNIALKSPNQSTPYIFGIWHQNIYLGIMAQNGLPHAVMVSKSKDADIVAYAVGKMGHIVERGSSRSGDKNKGGREAKDKLVERYRSGIPGAVAIDGPKGPAKHAKAGIFYMANEANVPIIPYLVLAERYWSFKSWDTFRLPKPFSRVIAYYGPPIQVNTTDDIEAVRNKLHEELEIAENTTKELFNDWKNLSKKNVPAAAPGIIS